MKSLLTALVLVMAPAATFAQCGHGEVTMTCADGTTYDRETGSCVPTTG